MKKTMISLLLACCMSISLQAQKNFLDVNYIEVQGTAEMKIIPDMIYLRIIINEKDFKNRVSINEQEKVMIEKLQAMGINTKKDLSMEDLSSSFRKRKFSLNDILLSKKYTLLVHDGKMASQVFTELEKLDISNISVINLDHSKILEYKKLTRANATKAAKEKATYMTEAIGQSIGKAIYIEEQNQNYARPMMANTAMYKSKSSESEDLESEIDFKDIEIESTVFVRFELK